MSMENKNLTDLTPAPRILPVTRSTPLPRRCKQSTVSRGGRFLRSGNRFVSSAPGLDGSGAEDSPDWHLTNGLLRLAQGLQQDHEAQEERLKSFARSWSPPHRN